MVYNAPATLCKDNFSFIIEFLGKLVEQAPVFFSFSLIFSLAKHPLRMTTQRMSGKIPSFLKVKGTGKRKLRQMKVSHVFNVGIH